MRIVANWVRGLPSGDTGVNIRAYDMGVPANEDEEPSLKDIGIKDLKQDEIDDPFKRVLAKLDVAISEHAEVGAHLLEALEVLELRLDHEEQKQEKPRNPVVLKPRGDLRICFFVNLTSDGPDSKKAIFRKLRFHLQQWKEMYEAKHGVPAKRVANG